MLVLYVDDDSEDVDNFKYILELVNPDYKFIHAKNGNDAMDLLNNCIILPDYIFVDINMPGMNGKELVAELKKDRQLKEIPTIVYTTSNRTEDQTLLRQLGANDYVIKPNTFKEAVEGIARVLRS